MLQGGQVAFGLFLFRLSTSDKGTAVCFNVGPT